MEDLEKVLEVFSERFEHIVPDRTDAKVIFSLFIDLKESNKLYCTEFEVKERIRKFHKQDTGTEREQRQRIEGRLQDLLRQQFVERDKEKNITLSDYSAQLCNIFLEKLRPLLKTSEIEKTLEDVKVTLENRSKSIADIQHWYDIQFTKVLKPEIANQVNALEYQIYQIEKDLNEKFKSAPFSELVDYFNFQMDIVIENRRKLTKAFNGLDSIIDILTETPLNEVGDMEFIQIKNNLNSTFEYYKFKLEKTEDRISQIKKIASSVFDKIDKKPFYRKFETFFYHVLADSQSTKKSNRLDKDETLYYSVEITLPEYVRLIENVKDTPDQYYYPEFHENFGVSKNQKIEAVNKNIEYLNTAAERSRKRQEQARQIEGWFVNIKSILDNTDGLDYSEFYYEVMNVEGNLDTAIKGTEYIIKKLRQENLNILSSNDFIISEMDKDNAIWRITINKSF